MPDGFVVDPIDIPAGSAPDTTDVDKRDLLTIFGLDKKIQVKDTFFHNANSAFRREIWKKIPLSLIHI